MNSRATLCACRNYKRQLLYASLNFLCKPCEKFSTDFLVAVYIFGAFRAKLSLSTCDFPMTARSETTTNNDT
jgi:hypothetical protein